MSWVREKKQENVGISGSMIHLKASLCVRNGRRRLPWGYNVVLPFYAKT